MGSYQASSTSELNLSQLLPKISQYNPINKNSNGIRIKHHQQELLYSHKINNKTAGVRMLQIGSNKKQFIEAYYLARQKMYENPHVFQLINYKIILSRTSSSHNQSSDLASVSSLCSVRNTRHNSANSQIYNVILFSQVSTISLQDQITNRINKKPFQQIELWSVLLSCTVGALYLLSHDCKQPVLSPKGIGLTQDGIIKVGEWEFASRMTQEYLNQDGQVIFGKFGQPISQINKSSLNQLLLNYYWAPEGLKAMQKFITLGQKQSQFSSLSHRNQYKKNQNQKYQIFSLGMTLVSMCLRNFYYRTDNFSEKYLLKLAHQAIQIRKIEGKQLSPELKQIIKLMIKWDPSERISYFQLNQLIVQYFNGHPDQMRNSSISMKTFSNMSLNDKLSKGIKSRTQSQTSNITMNFTEDQSLLDSCTFAFAQAGMKINKPNKLRREVHSNSTGSAFEGYEGSGTVQQGSGDNDEYLQNQKQETVLIKQTQDEQQISSQPVTHRTDHQLKQKQSSINGKSEKNCISKNNSPYLMNKSGMSSIINIVSSPFVDKINREQLKKQKEIVLESQKQKDRKQSVHRNQIYLEQNQKLEKQQVKMSIKGGQVRTKPGFRIPLADLSINTSMSIISVDYHLKPDKQSNLNSNRGSYRCSSKQPPKLNSARIYLENKVNQQEHGYKLKPASQFSVSIKESITNTIQPVYPDLEDEFNQVLSYTYFYNTLHDQQLQFQNPDIFQIFSDRDENNNEGSQISHQLSNTSSQISINAEQVKNKITSNVYKNSQYQKQFEQISKRQNHVDDQFMTFNKKPTASLENNFQRIDIQQLVPSKWKKTETIKDSIMKKRKQQESLFTDPKLLEYIRSPLGTSKNYQKQDVFGSHSNEFIHIVDDQDKQVCQQKVKKYEINKENITNLCNKSHGFSNQKPNEAKSFNDKQKRQYYQGQNTKIFKEQVSRGFYEGEKKNGLRSGYGVFYYNEGGKYKGNWLNNKMHGKGTLQYSDGRIAYQGDWLEDELHGKGILYNQSPIFVTEGLNYYDFDELDEVWVFYQGSFKHDDKSGLGLLVLSNHEQFIGQFENDMAEGIGEYMKVDGSLIKGIWHKNKLIKLIQK